MWVRQTPVSTHGQQTTGLSWERLTWWTGRRNKQWMIKYAFSATECCHHVKLHKMCFYKTTVFIVYYWMLHSSWTSEQSSCIERSFLQLNTEMVSPSILIWIQFNISLTGLTLYNKSIIWGLVCICLPFTFAVERVNMGDWSLSTSQWSQLHSDLWGNLPLWWFAAICPSAHLCLPVM